MAEEPTPNNYRIALNHSQERLRQHEPAEMATKAGAQWDEDRGLFHMTLSNLSLALAYPSGKIWVVGDNENRGAVSEGLTTGLKIMATNYLWYSKGTPLSHQYVTFKDVPGGHLFYPAFHRSAIKPIAETFSGNLAAFERAATSIGGTPVEFSGDLAVLFWFFPMVPVIYVLWQGDDEVSGNANILFDATIADYMITEDIAGVAWLSKRLLQNTALDIFDPLW